MVAVEIPLLREAIAFSARLIAAARRFDEPRYHSHRRVNWSHRYSDRFYVREAECFSQAPEAYLAGHLAQPSELQDVYLQQLGPRQVVVATMKVLAHWLFRLLGRTFGSPPRPTYRKCYVDDIELVFDPAEADVMRAVYPFPLSARRQWRYLASLRRERSAYRLAGHAYLPSDLMHFLVRRNVRSLMRMESRAQILHAQEILASGVRTVQLSDEFDIGSLDFCRRLGRGGAHVVNSAHGVGKYLPVHAYREFHVLTEKQLRYYHAVGECRYALRRLNDRSAQPAPATPSGPVRNVNLVFLSQSSAGASQIITENERRVVNRLREAFRDEARVALYYKPHPNREQPQPPDGFAQIIDLAAVNGRPGTLFVSFFSTCQIDPAFKGRKVLLRGDRVYPDIVFDDSEPIVDLDGLIRLVESELAQAQASSNPHESADETAR